MTNAETTYVLPDKSIFRFHAERATVITEPSAMSETEHTRYVGDGIGHRRIKAVHKARVRYSYIVQKEDGSKAALDDGAQAMKGDPVFLVYGGTTPETVRLVAVKSGVFPDFRLQAKRYAQPGFTRFGFVKEWWRRLPASLRPVLAIFLVGITIMSMGTIIAGLVIILVVMDSMITPLRIEKADTIAAQFCRSLS